jgi:hypothetical protein
LQHRKVASLTCAATYSGENNEMILKKTKSRSENSEVRTNPVMLMQKIQTGLII